jgi:hypothetical protein
MSVPTSRRPIAPEAMRQIDKFAIDGLRHQKNCNVASVSVRPDNRPGP